MYVYISIIFINQIYILFRFKANQLLSEDKTYIDLLPDEKKNTTTNTNT